MKKALKRDQDAAPSAVYAFLTSLAEDPFAEDAYATDPCAALERAGLSADEADELSARGPSFGEHGVAAGEWASCQTCSDPGPDPFPEAG